MLVSPIQKIKMGNVVECDWNASWEVTLDKSEKDSWENDIWKGTWTLKREEISNKIHTKGTKCVDLYKGIHLGQLEE